MILVGITITGRCYCGAIELNSTQAPKAVAYCHCDDCRRVTGAPVAAFAAFDETAVSLIPNDGRSVSVHPGVARSFCENCGSPLMSRYDYLPGTVYISLGLIDQADLLAPQLHAHESNRFSWLTIDDECKRCPASARTELNSVGSS